MIRSLPGMGVRLGAKFIAATGGDLDAFGSAERLAGFAGLAPQPRDSGRVSGNLRRPRRYHRGLLRTMYVLPRLQGVLPTKTERREGTQTSSPCPRPPTRQRPVGDDP